MEKVVLQASATIHQKMTGRYQVFTRSNQ